MHNAYWEPMWKAVADTDTAICLHIGCGDAAPHASNESPIEANIATMPMAVAVGAADWLNLDALHRYPGMKVAWTASGIGWIPYLMERADYSHEQHHVWTSPDSYFRGMKPSDVFRRHYQRAALNVGALRAQAAAGWASYVAAVARPQRPAFAK